MTIMIGSKLTSYIYYQKIHMKDKIAQYLCLRADYIGRLNCKNLLKIKLVIYNYVYFNIYPISDSFLMEFLKDVNFVREQDFLDVLKNLGRNPNGRHQVWAFVREYWYAITYK